MSFHFITGLENTIKAIRMKIRSLTIGGIRIAAAIFFGDNDDDNDYYGPVNAIEPADMRNSEELPTASNDDSEEMINTDDSFDGDDSDETINSEDSFIMAINNNIGICDVSLDAANNNIINNDESSDSADEQVGEEISGEEMIESDEDSEGDFENMGFEVIH